MSAFRQVAFIVNASKPGALDLAGRLQEVATGLGMRSRLVTSFPVIEDEVEGCDACCTIGGDGTILGAVPVAVRHGIPLLGINLGKLGFMATCNPADAAAALARLAAGELVASPRTLLQCQAGDGVRHLALNDVVIKFQSSRLARIGLSSAAEVINTYDCDGLILATPTGSTAYNLSAGGPIIHPGARVLVVTPICPHTLSNRSVIFDEHTRLTVSLEDPGVPAWVSLDGSLRQAAPEAFPLAVGLAPETVSLLQPPGHSHYDLIRRKLHWGSPRARLES